MKYLVFLLLTCCSSLLDERHFEIAPELNGFVNDFYRIAAKKHYKLPENLIVRFGDTIKKDGVIAETFYGDINIIELDYSLKERIYFDSLFIETVLYHEFGHALFLRQHCFYCYSLMNPNKYISDFRMDSVKRQILINELFSK